MLYIVVAGNVALLLVGLLGIRLMRSSVGAARAQELTAPSSTAEAEPVVDEGEAATVLRTRAFVAGEELDALFAYDSGNGEHSTSNGAHTHRSSHGVERLRPARDITHLPGTEPAAEDVG